MNKSALILLKNPEGHILLQLRAAGDDSYPLHWDFSAAGGIDEGEEPLAAAMRELQEEIGIQAELQFVAEDTYKEDAVFIYTGLIKSEEDFQLDSTEVERVKFFPPELIQHMIGSCEKFHPEFLYIFNTYFNK